MVVSQQPRGSGRSRPPSEIRGVRTIRWSFCLFGRRRARITSQGSNGMEVSGRLARGQLLRCRELRSVRSQRRHFAPSRARKSKMGASWCWFFWNCRWRQTAVAMRVLRDVAHSEDMMLFEREVKMMATLNPSVVQLLGFTASLLFSFSILTNTGRHPPISVN